MKTDKDTIQRTIHPHVRVLDAARGLVEYVASDETLDSYDEVIRAAGWRFDERFEKNPVFIDSHSYWGIRDVIGRVVEWRVEGNQLVEVVQWAVDVEENALARLGFAMTAKGYLKAVSVGFVPVRRVRRNDEDFSAVADEMKLAGEVRDRVRTIHYEQQQYELSACVIGANPSALAKAFGDGAVSGELLDQCGLRGDEGREMLDLAARAFDATGDGAVRDLIRLQLRQFAGRNISAGRGGSPATPHPRHGSAGGDHRQRSQESRAWLNQVADNLWHLD
ncbi:MAG TPA: hypothetical protein PLA50_00350 [Bacteroidia bacterium]|nr:hypothetical protein [Bacteroidia bacterium]